MSTLQLGAEICLDSMGYYVFNVILTGLLCRWMDMILFYALQKLFKTVTYLLTVPQRILSLEETSYSHCMGCTRALY